MKLSKKKKSATNIKQNNKRLKELEDVIYTYRAKDLLAYFLEEFRYGKKKNQYKRSVSLLYDLDIECLEFAISRFHNIDNERDPARYFAFLTPFITVYITTAFKIYEDTWVLTVVWAVALIIVMRSLNKSRKDRIISGTMLKTFEQVKARKEKDEK
ncbi:hypothetical protein LC035_06645 [Bacillus stratosphericus]|nr:MULTISPECIES: hypothetical protein [Bacillus]KML17543.1 hypothetical protein VL09_08445 [Bacillus stratosphericus]KML63922.1 hypothetical protein VL19_02870 [Bacillus stratosphericus]KMN30469.1 hypothetical protein ABW26_16480 [Bacillus stratosphericus]KMN71639.1 hypothetical protein VK97_13950 [Bacillus sp. LK10]MCA1013336.1 hypothetical protein [Bacillus stratosphericus]